MKKRISLFLATSFIFSSFAFTYGATENNATTYNSVVSSIPKTVTKGISKTSINNIVYGTSNTGVKDIDGVQYINDTPLTIYQNTPPEKMTILLKRAMLKAARLVAEKNKSMALVTGDSIGQVASQTMHAINAIDSAVTDMPVLRPLCAMDKQEIVDWARKIGTFDISIRPYEDCCTVFVAKHPETKPKKSIIENIERKIEGLDELIEQAVEESKIYEF